MRRKSLAGICATMFLLGVSALSWVPADFNKTDNTKTTGVTINNTEINKKHEASNLQLFTDYINNIYTEAGLSSSNLDGKVFRKAVTGYYNLKSKNLLSANRQIVTIVDFNRSSRTKRLWIIDLENKKLLFNTLVAHGQGSGEDMATDFSNVAESHQSSLGFYVTTDIYYGKHGRSLKLDGMDTNFNTNALDRSVVVHGAEYVSQGFINQHGRLGRSYGCPAVPVEFTNQIIDTIKDNTCLFINGPSDTYNSSYLNIDTAVENFIKADTKIAVL
ncbi:murein L,D-transpeptidase catalytic domain family protein [Rubrolithibacter danxiaensis]|uniref:murein L,D-transpeptidase catalytic domain family protein n=1 Tax=Rubrolithibacter danxiaensis TaxID=3390805 RepID=UPI003BF89578